MAAGTYSFKGTADMSQHNEQIKKAKKEVAKYKDEVVKAQNETNKLSKPNFSGAFSSQKQLQDTVKTTTNVVNGLKGGLTNAISKFGPYAAAAAAGIALATKGIQKCMEQSDYWTDKFKGTMEGLGGATNQLAYQLGKLDFSNLISNMQAAWNNARNLYDALDALGTFNIINDDKISEIETQLEELRTRSRQGEDVTDLIKQKEDELEQALRDGIPRIEKAKAELIKSAVNWDDRYRNHDWGWTDENAGQLWDAIIGYKALDTSEIERRIKSIKSKMKSMTRGASNASPVYTSAEYKALDKDLYALEYALKVTDEEIKSVNEQNEALRQIRRRMAQTKRQDLRFIDHTKGLPGAPKSTKIEDELLPEGSIAELERRIAKLKKAYSLATTDEGEGGRFALLEQIKEAEDELKKLKFDPSSLLPEGSIAQLEARLKELKADWQLASTDEKRAEIQAEMDKVQAEIDRISNINVPVKVKTPRENIQEMIDDLRRQLELADTPELKLKIGFNIDQLTQDMERLAESLKTPSEKIQDEIDKIKEKYEKLGEASRTCFGMMSGAVGTWAQIEQNAYEANEANMTEAEKAEHKRTQAYLQGMQQIINAIGEAIPAILSLVAADEAEALAAGTAQAAKLHFPANLAAIATVFSSVMSVIAAISAISSAAKFAGGGIFDGSGPKFGDMHVARVNPGEMILNETQQANLFKLLNGNIITDGGIGNNGGHVDFRISGTDLVGVLNNNNKQRRRVE